MNSHQANQKSKTTGDMIMGAIKFIRNAFATAISPPIPILPPKAGRFQKAHQKEKVSAFVKALKHKVAKTQALKEALSGANLPSADSKTAAAPLGSVVKKAADSKTATPPLDPKVKKAAELIGTILENNKLFKLDSKFTTVADYKAYIESKRTADFYLREPHPLKLKDYFVHLAEKGAITWNVLIAAYCYIEQMFQFLKKAPLNDSVNEYNLHRIIFTSLLLAKINCERINEENQNSFAAISFISKEDSKNCLDLLSSVITRNYRETSTLIDGDFYKTIQNRVNAMVVANEKGVR